MRVSKMLKFMSLPSWSASALVLLFMIVGCGKEPSSPALSASPAQSSASASTRPVVHDKKEPSQSSPDRIAAEWVVGIGGEVQVEEAGKRLPVKSSEDLPAGEFHIVSVNLANNNRVTDEGLSALEGAKKLETLNLNGTSITSSGVARLSSLTGVKYLNLSVPSLGDSDLLVFKNLPELYALEISSTQIGDAGLKNLNGCNSLRTLYVSQTNVTDEGVTTLKSALPQLDVKR